MSYPDGIWAVGKFVRWKGNGHEYQIYAQMREFAKIQRGSGRHMEILVVRWDEIEFL